MKDIMYNELRKCGRKICLEIGARKKSGDRTLAETAQALIGLSYIARKEGLLALETAGHSETPGMSEFLKKILLLVVDGTDPELVEEIGLRTYFLSDPEGYEALNMIICLYGILSVQAGENPRVLEEKVLAMLPTDAERTYRGTAFDDDGMFVNPFGDVISARHPTKHKPEDYFLTERVAAEPGSGKYFLYNATDFALRHMSDRDVQRLLREVENGELVVALKALTGKGVEKVFSNMSERLVKRLAADMDDYGPVKAKDAANICWKICNIIKALEDRGEIVMNDSKAFRYMLRYASDDEACNDGKRPAYSEGEYEVMELLRQYKEHRFRTIDAPRLTDANTEDE